MVILDPPYVSEELIGYLSRSREPVLDNETARRAANSGDLNLISPDAFRSEYREGTRLYTASEFSLDWVTRNLEDPGLKDRIVKMKNKGLFRRLVAPMYPDFACMELSLEELSTVDIRRMTFPFVLKPVLGFFSVGVYSIAGEEDWERAVAEITAHARDWNRLYPESVVNNRFLLEPYIEGEEYALDAYYNEEGKPIILNILKHDFFGSQDVSDRLYYTGKTIMEEHLGEFTEWLKELNQYLRIRDFPFHAEIRVKDGKIVPIEFNPLRFAGWCCTDLSLYAYGFLTVEYYLRNQAPDWEKLLEKKDEDSYILMALGKADLNRGEGVYDYEALLAAVPETIRLRRVEDPEQSTYGFLFARIPAGREARLEELLTMDLERFFRG